MSIRFKRLIWLAGLAQVACITVNTVNIGSKTSLEKQLMGEFEPLTDEELLMASVRASPAATSSPGYEDQAAALVARQRQLFNRDDVRTLKVAGCLGEALGAKLVSRPCNKTDEPGTLALTRRLLDEENFDRQTIIAWVLATDLALTAKDVATVAGLYHRLLVEQAGRGEWVQQDDGLWVQR